LKRSDFNAVSAGALNKQLTIAILFVLAVFGVLVLRLWFLQIVSGSTYRTKSESNRIHLQDILPFRGMIFDRKGEMLVGNRPSYDLYIIPEGVQDRGQLVRELNWLTGIESKQIERKFDEESPKYPFKPVCLKKDISRDELAVIETQRFNLPGVMIKIKPQRYYVFKTIASHLLGYLGEINEVQLKSGQYPANKQGDLIGKSGVEWKWQAFLNGIRGGEQVEVDAAGRKLRVISKKGSIPGANVYLTIDKALQSIAEKALTEKKGAIVALDPNNGKILALASSPFFDPNLFVGGIDKRTWQKIISSKDYPLQNRALTGQYPPGSVFKIVVAIAGLAEGVIDPEEELVCKGVYTLGRQKYRCWKKYGHGRVNLHKALVESCDVYFYKIGKRLGVDKIASYAKAFGLGKTSGFDIGQEEPGLIPTSQWKLKRFGNKWQAGETISMSIGQSFVLVTPIQMANLMSAVFNGGILYRPQVTERAGKNGTEKFYEFSPIAKKVKIKDEYLELVRSALIGVVNEPGGTGSRARLKDITVAGKTGTAQVVSLKKVKDLENNDEIPYRFRDHAWFIAVAPADKPRIALAIIVEHSGHGGKVAAPIAKKMIKCYLGARR
jgi:penicillin-binding protein 2